MSADPFAQWEVRSSTGRHLKCLDGMRGIAILMVVAYHTFYTNPESGTIARAIGALIGVGGLGVPIFFVLSGFLISYPFFRSKAEGRSWRLPGYVSRRAAKIIPPFYLSILIFIPWYIWQQKNFDYAWIGLQWMFGIPNFVRNDLPLHTSWWSLVIEVHFYALLPGLFFLAKRIPLKPAAGAIFGLLFAAPIVTRFITWPGDAAPCEQIAFLMSRFPCQLDHFSWGVLFAAVYASLGQAKEEMRSLSLFGYAGNLLLVACIVLSAYWGSQYDLALHPRQWSVEISHLLPGLATFLLLFFVFDSQSLGARFLAMPWLRFVGIVSYEWFLFHQPVVSCFAERFGSTKGSLGLYLLKTAVPLILTFALSAALYRFFSLPLMRRFRSNERSGR